MQHLAIDLGSRESQICIRNSDGDIVSERKLPIRTPVVHVDEVRAAEATPGGSSSVGARASAAGSSSSGVEVVITSALPCASVVLWRAGALPDVSVRSIWLRSKSQRSCGLSILPIHSTKECVLFHSD
jgi:hypothetical protein